MFPKGHPVWDWQNGTPHSMHLIGVQRANLVIKLNSFEATDTPWKRAKQILDLGKFMMVEYTDEKVGQLCSRNKRDGTTCILCMLVAWQRAKGQLKRNQNLRQESNLQPTTSVTPVGCSNHWATGTPGELGCLSRFLYKVYHWSAGSTM